MAETKPGIKTSEFWGSTIISLIGILAAFNFLTPEQSGELTKVAVPVGGLIAAAIASFGYSRSRGQAKKSTKPLMTDNQLREVVKAVGEREVLFEKGEVKKYIADAIAEFGKKKTLIE